MKQPFSFVCLFLNSKNLVHHLHWPFIAKHEPYLITKKYVIIAGEVEAWKQEKSEWWWDPVHVRSSGGTNRLNLGIHYEEDMISFEKYKIFDKSQKWLQQEPKRHENWKIKKCCVRTLNLVSPILSSSIYLWFKS